MSNFRRFIRQIPLMIIWLMASVLIWGFVFTRITDTTRDRKITIFVDAEIRNAEVLETKLESHKRGRIRMVQVRPFHYAMLDSTVLTNADIYLVSGSHMSEYRDWFAPWPDSAEAVMPAWEEDGVCYGRLISSPILDYDPIRNDLLIPGSDDVFFLCFGKNSIHLEGLPGAVDNEAVYYAGLLR